MLSGTGLFRKVPLRRCPRVFGFLRTSVLSFRGSRLVRRLKRPLLCSKVILSKAIRKSFVGRGCDGVGVGRFRHNQSFTRTLTYIRAPCDPVRLGTLAGYAVVLVGLGNVVDNSSYPYSCRLGLAAGVLGVLTSRGIFSGLGLEVTGRGSLESQVLVCLRDLTPSSRKCLRIPFARATLTRFLNMGQDTLSERLNHVRSRGLVRIGSGGVGLLL